MSAGFQIVKAGWLFRESSVLRRWKRNWFVLGSDGLLRYYESQDSSRAEEVYLLRRDCSRIVTGSEVKCTPPDSSYGKSCLFELKMRDADNLYLCAESADDMKAWQVALEQALPSQGPVPPVGATPVGAYGYTPPVHVTYQHTGLTFGGFPGQVVTPAQVISTTDGRTTVINPVPPTQMMFIDDPFDYCYRSRRYTSGPVYMTTRYYY